MTTVALVLEIEELVFDTLELRADALVSALRVEGIAIAHDVVEAAHAGVTAATALDRITEAHALDVVTRDLVLTRAADRIRADFQRALPTFDAAARDALLDLAGDVPVAVVTRAARADAQLLLLHAGLEPVVRTIRSLGDLPESAHDAIWSDAGARLPVATRIAVTRAALLAAPARAGFATIAIELAPSHADATLASLAQLDASFLSSFTAIHRS